MPEALSWVSKTDITCYLRCPYAFWLVDTNQVAPQDAIDGYAHRLMAQGTEFQALVEAQATPVMVQPGDLPALFSEELMLLATPQFENAEQRIFGRPDGIVTAKGALFPIEVKSHAKVQALDKLELAFYWLVLTPYRTRDAPPEGKLVLRANEGPGTVTVPITDEHLRRVETLIEDVRLAGRDGVGSARCCAGRRCWAQ